MPICQFELPTSQFAQRLGRMREALGPGADENLFVDTFAAGQLLSTTAALNHFLAAARSAAAEVIVLDPLCSAHDQDENDTRAMAALCQTLLKMREASGTALVVVHHVRKSVARYEVGSAFRGSSALNAVGNSYLLLTRSSPELPTVELRLQFRYAAPLAPRLLTLDSSTLWFTATGSRQSPPRSRRKVERADVEAALVSLGSPAPYGQLRDAVMAACECSKRTAWPWPTPGRPDAWSVTTGFTDFLPSLRPGRAGCKTSLPVERRPKADATEAESAPPQSPRQDLPPGGASLSIPSSAFGAEAFGPVKRDRPRRLPSGSTL